MFSSRIKSATGKESDHGLLSMSSLVAKAVIGEKSDSGLLLASSSEMKAVIGEGDSDSVLLSMYSFGREAGIGEEYLFRIIVGCGLILIVGKCRFILYVVTEYYQGSSPTRISLTSDDVCWRDDALQNQIR